MDYVEQQHLIKGEKSWLDIAIDRKPTGLDIYIKTDPRIEETMSTMSHGSKSNLSNWGTTWQPPKDTQIEVYDVVEDINGSTYYLDGLGLSLKDNKGRINLSMLRMAGIGSEHGIRFTIIGPHSKQFTRETAKSIVDGTRELIREYIVPVHIEWKLSERVY